MSQDKYLPVKGSQIYNYTNIPLFCRTSSNKYIIYKPAGETLQKIRLSQARHPKLYLNFGDRIEAIKENQKAMNEYLVEKVASKNIIEVKTLLCDLVDEALSDPQEGTLDEMPETIDIIFLGYSKNSAVFKTLASISDTHYNTSVHSVNVMALTMRFCFYCNYSIEFTKKLGLCALLHDVGKVEMPENILNAKKRLTDQEFKILKTHTTIGYDIIKNNENFDDSIAKGALEHHEKIDGTGYPNGITNVSFEGQLLGMIDSFETLSSKRKTQKKTPFETLSLIKKELLVGKFDNKIFQEFCISLV